MWQSLRKTPLPVALLVLGIVSPAEFSIYFGSVRLPMHRVAILIFFLPALYRFLLSGKSRIAAFDVYLFVFAAWVLGVFIMHQGVNDGLQFGGSLAVESFGGYLISRVYIRDYASFRSTLDLLFVSIMVVGALALPEATFGHHYVHDWLRIITGYVHPVNEEKRLGILRSYSTFDHPILYGSFCASVLAMVWMTRDSMARRVSRTGLIVGATYLGASSAPLLIILVQGMIMVWEKLTRGIRYRVSMVFCSLVVFYLLVELLSNQSAITAISTRITLDPWTAYYRTLIWQYGIQNLMEHPIFGLGLGDWDRVSWMASSSVDAFWLLIPLRTGLPSLAFLLTGIGLLLRGVHGRNSRHRPAALQRCAVAWTISFLALSLAALTVHYWNSVHAYFFFFLGLAGWLADPIKVPQPAAEVTRRWPAGRTPMRIPTPMPERLPRPAYTSLH